MKAVMISIHPEWCEKILKGEKTIELRKTKPKLKPPFKCYIYCTQGKGEFSLLTKSHHDGQYHRAPRKDAKALECVGNQNLNGKVVAEFVCDYVYTLESEFTADDSLEQIVVRAKDEDGEDYTKQFATNEDFDSEKDWQNYLAPFFEIRIKEIRKYIGLGFKNFYGWRISDLKIYDRPKRIQTFKGLKQSRFGWMPYWLKKAPQSWCYVEQLEE